MLLTQHSKFRLKEKQGELGSAHPLYEIKNKNHLTEFWVSSSCRIAHFLKHKQNKKRIKFSENRKVFYPANSKKSEF